MLDGRGTTVAVMTLKPITSAEVEPPAPTVYQAVVQPVEPDAGAGGSGKTEPRWVYDQDWP